MPKYVLTLHHKLNKFLGNKLLLLILNFKNMKKIFTTALMAAALAVSANAEEMRIYLQDSAPVNVPDGVTVVQYAAGSNDVAGDIKFYIWENTFSVEGGMDATYGEYNNWVVGTAGWWGAGYNVPPKRDANGNLTGSEGVDFSMIDATWNLHFAFKTDITDGDICFNIGAEVPGAKDANGNGVMPSIKFNAATSTDYKFDGTWNVVDLPITYFFDQYASEEQAIEEFCKVYRDANYLTFTGGGSTGKKVAFTDIYLYGEGASGAVEGVEVESPVVATEYYNFQGQRLHEAPQHGMFIVKSVKANGSFEVSKVAK